MFKAIDEGLAVYKDELAKYKKAFCPNNELGESLDTQPKHIAKAATEATQFLQGMEKALGLTREEIKKLEIEFGIPQ